MRSVVSPGALIFSSTFSGDREIFSSAADGSSRVDLSKDPHADVTPAWSTDGLRIAFASNRSGAFEIYVMNANGSDVVQVTHDHAYDDRPSFTGYDKALVYESNVRGNWEIRRIALDGSGEIDLTQNRAADRYPAPAPGGAIAFASNRGGSDWHLWVMRSNGTHAVQLTRQPGGQSQPAWNPSGAKIAFVAGTPGQGTSIWSMLRNGTKPRRVAAGSGRDESSPAWSPDGTSIVYQDCSAGASTECGVRTVVPGSPPFDVSTLRAPWVDTFDGGDSRFWQVISNGKGATNTEQNGQLVTTLAADSAEGGQYNEIETHWGTRSGSSATSTCRRITGCSSGRRQTVCRRRFRRSPALRTSASWLSAKARPGASSTAPGSRRTSSRSGPGIRRGRCDCSDRATPPRRPIGTVPAGSSSHRARRSPIRPPSRSAQAASWGGSSIRRFRSPGQLPHQRRRDFLQHAMVGGRLAGLAR